MEAVLSRHSTTNYVYLWILDGLNAKQLTVVGNPSTYGSGDESVPVTSTTIIAHGDFSGGARVVSIVDAVRVE